MLAVDNLTIQYGDSTAVQDVTFKVESGECVGLVGESGAGKSTIGLAVLGLAGTPTGSIQFCGTELVGTDSATLRSVRGAEIGLAFQDADDALHPAYSVGEQIAESIDGRRRNWRRRHQDTVESLLGNVDLDSALAGQYPHQISGGQKQRALLAVALAGDPELLIADEPTSSLDTVTKASVLETIERLSASRDLSVLFITHDLGIVQRACDRTLVLRDGRIVERGQTNMVFSDPTHEYTESLVGIRQQPTAAVDGGKTSTGHVLVELECVSKAYDQGSVLDSLLGRDDRTVAVEDCSLAVREGEAVGLLGRSGAGKTTLARLVAGLETPTDGTVSLKGTDVGSIGERSPVHREAIGYVFQSPRASLDPRRTVAESVAEPLGGNDSPELSARGRVGELLETVGLTGYEQKYPRELSGGEAQRVAVARALAVDPDLLVLDEATSALDTITADRCCTLFERLRRERGLTMLVVTHDVEIARRLTDRTLVLENGRIVERDETAAILADPETKPAQTLVESAYTLQQ
ncbi:ABC transporter ATP-binding protein [Halovenus salina]|uniref:ABC transporter ATP-binding protein n=1 Tax=Halovenus salina TaxID=1510225 RepID=A0ABD5W3E7_9EURY|nr:ABC transporter ATP-binding protein [Halovenus salina]